jgi:hypothetical protein
MRVRPVPAALISAVASIAIAACSLFTPLDGFVTGSSEDGGSTEAGSADAPITPTDGATPSQDANVAPDTGVDAKAPPANLHLNGGFDKSCDAWNTYVADKSFSQEGHLASGSCRFCGNDSMFFSGDDGSFVENPPPGKYHVEGWVRSAPEKAVPTNGVRVFLRTTNFGDVPFQEVEKNVGPLVQMTTTWVKLEIDLTVTKPAGHLNAVFAGEGGPTGACFLLDDVYAFKYAPE